MSFRRRIAPVDSPILGFEAIIHDDELASWKGPQENNQSCFCEHGESCGCRQPGEERLNVVSTPQIGVSLFWIWTGRVFTFDF